MVKGPKLTISENLDEEKYFATLRAAAALGGLELMRTNPADGRVTYLGSWKGVVRELGTDLIIVAGFVRVMGGTI
jgi:hypothetical protein